MFTSLCISKNNEHLNIDTVFCEKLALTKTFSDKEDIVLHFCPSICC